MIMCFMSPCLYQFFFFLQDHQFLAIEKTHYSHTHLEYKFEVDLEAPNMFGKEVLRIKFVKQNMFCLSKAQNESLGLKHAIKISNLVFTYHKLICNQKLGMNLWDSSH